MNNLVEDTDVAAKPTTDPVVAVKDHLEVTGVSRSGRVCKKSSKLLDFQAADEMEPKPKRSIPSKKPPITPKKPNSTTSRNKSLRKNEQRQRSKLESTKGKSHKSATKSDHHRPTAYTLWAKDYRARMKVTQPNVKTSSYAHRLSGLWAEVPNSEKYSWRRRARRAVDQTQEQQKLNEKLAANKRMSGTPANGLANRKPLDNPYENVTFGTLSLDAAAHLKLLGENLNLIGERLKDHEGQVNVSGTLSVLLDSIMCSMGPLMVLTKAIPNVRNEPELNRSINNTIDNISYIMPGL